MSKSIKKWLVAASVVGALPWQLHAETVSYPKQAITLVVPFSPGGGVDVMGRLLAERLRQTLNQNIIVENRPGASGMLGASHVVRAKPDGYTVLLGSAGETAINPYVYGDRMSYQLDNLQPVALLSRVPNVLLAGPAMEAADMASMLDYVRANPGRVNYATSGLGNPQHLNGALLEHQAQVSMVHIPYRGAAGQLADVAGGSVELTFVSYAAAVPFLQSGKVRALAVTSANRTGFAPDIPALSETPGLENYDLSNWFGLFVPAATPAEIVQALNQATNEALADPELAEKLQAQGAELTPLSVADFTSFIAQESSKYEQIVREAGIVAE